MALLETVHSPADIKRMNKNQLIVLAHEIREFLITSCSKNGGHLASNLGTVELTLALHKCFDCPQDSFVFDVGHQCYTHKLVTGRMEGFSKLRKRGGVSGFPKPAESEYDSFVVGHSSTSISSAIGLARAKILNNDNSKVIAIIGDGSFGGGMAYEAMNNLDSSLDNLIVVLNDNEMSISKSVGSLARYLLKLRTSAGYTNTKRRVQSALEKSPVIGKFIMKALLKAKSSLRRAIYNGTFFEELGFNYIGPVDGHDIGELISIFNNIKTMNGPILVHAITSKGKGFTPAEENPGAYHGVGKFNVEQGNPDISLADSFSNTFGHKLVEIAESNNNICAVTAAMKYGTGLQYFYHTYPDRFFDVGIAEEHATTFCAGLAKGGMKPVFAVYSTFLQRAFDQLNQDVMLCNADVLLAIDRAGVVGDDGETHQGLLDVSMLSTIGGFTVASPCNYAELEYWLERLCTESGPRAIRYPRGTESERLGKLGCTEQDFDIIKGGNSAKFAIVTYGRETEQALIAQEILQGRGLCVDIIKLNRILPLSSDAVAEASKYSGIIFAEEGVQNGGICERMRDALDRMNFEGSFVAVAAQTSAIHTGTIDEQLADIGIDADSLVERISQWL